MQTQGARANSSGQFAERMVEEMLKAKGWSFRRQVVVGVSIYGHRLRADIVVDPRPSIPKGLVIECKWQDVPGSVDEKFPYVVENIRADAYKHPVVVIIGGGKAKLGAVRWLAMQQLSECRLVGVFGIEEFMKWVSRQ